VGMSSDQFDPDETVRVRFKFADGSSLLSERMPRRAAELLLASEGWIVDPVWEGQPVLSAAIIPWKD
jgi:hypothetical protein